MKRPIVEGDFRSNVSQVNQNQMELTELEKEEVMKVVNFLKPVEGDVVGVDLIPSQNREKDKPYF